MATDMANIRAKTGNAETKMVGQTASTRFGSNPDEKGNASTSARDLTIR